MQANDHEINKSKTLFLPLMEATKGSSQDLEKLLVDITDIDVLYPQEWSSLILVARKKMHKDNLILLLTKMVSLATPETGLKMATKAIEDLVTNLNKSTLSKLCTEIKNPEGFTLLYFLHHCEVKSAREFAIEVSKNNKDESKLLAALKEDRFDDVKCLTKGGANLNPHRQHDEVHPYIDIICSRGQLFVREFDSLKHSEHLNILNFMLNHGATIRYMGNIAPQFDLQIKLFDLAGSLNKIHGDPSLFESIIVSSKLNKHNLTILLNGLVWIQHAYPSLLSSVEALVKNGANPNDRNYEMCAMQIATIHSPRCLKPLLSHGGDPNLEIKYHGMPFRTVFVNIIENAHKFRYLDFDIKKPNAHFAELIEIMTKKTLPATLLRYFKMKTFVALCLEDRETATKFVTRLQKIMSSQENDAVKEILAVTLISEYNLYNTCKLMLLIRNRKKGMQLFPLSKDMLQRVERSDFSDLPLPLEREYDSDSECTM